MAHCYDPNKGMRMHSIYRLSDAQPDWAQDDPSQPDYIKNKELVEKFRPILVNGTVFLDETHASGSVNFVAGNNISIKTDGNKIIISSKGGEGGMGIEYVPGAGISITENKLGQMEVSIALEYLESILSTAELLGTPSETSEEGEVTKEATGLYGQVEKQQKEIEAINEQLANLDLGDCLEIVPNPENPEKFIISQNGVDVTTLVADLILTDEVINEIIKAATPKWGIF